MSVRIAAIANQEWGRRDTFQANFAIVKDVPMSELGLTVGEFFALQRLAQSCSANLLHGVQPQDGEILHLLVARAHARPVKMPWHVLLKVWWRRLMQH